MANSASMDVNFEPLKVFLQHSKVRALFPMILICLLLVLIHVPTGYSMHLNYVFLY